MLYTSILLSSYIVITMWRNVYKKKVVIVTFILALSFIHCIFGLWSPAFSATIPKSEDILSEKAKNSNEGKPDLVIDDIFLWPSNQPYEYHFEYRLKNIGDAPIYNFQLKTTIQIRWLLLGSIPLFSIYLTTHNGLVGRLLSNETISIPFISCDALPKFGSYRFSLTVNPNKIIDESDYDNNKYSEDWSVFFGEWNPLP